MLKLKEIELTSRYRHGYDPGAVPGIGCKVKLQHGDKSYDTFELELPSEAVKRVVALALTEALALLAIDPDCIDVEGRPGTPKPQPTVAELTKEQIENIDPI